MNDTHPEIARLLREHYERMTPQERFLIGVRMFETARAIAMASFPRNLTPAQLRYRLCERLYGSLADEVYPDRRMQIGRRTDTDGRADG